MELKINLSQFNEYLIQCLRKDFNESTKGIRDRIINLSASFSHINTLLQQCHQDETNAQQSDSGCLAHLENIMAVIYSVTVEI